MNELVGRPSGLREVSELEAGWDFRKPEYRREVCGIYEIFCVISRKSYIGSSFQIYWRWYKHRWDLNKKEHSNKHLQSAWNLYGPENFDWRIIEIVPRENLLKREQFWVNEIIPEYNIAPVGRAPSTRGKTFTHKNPLARQNYVASWTKERREKQRQVILKIKDKIRLACVAAVSGKKQPFSQKRSNAAKEAWQRRKSFV